MIASVFTALERLSEAIARTAGLDPATGAGAALAFLLHEFVKVSILILVISWGMALIRRSLPMARVRRWLATPFGRTLGYPAAAGFGAVTPFCSCSSVPLFIGFIEAGIPVGVTFAFLITSPLVNEIVVALFLASFGWKVAALYAASGIVIGITGGYALQAMRAERWLSPFARGLRSDGNESEANNQPCCSNCCSDHLDADGDPEAPTTNSTCCAIEAPDREGPTPRESRARGAIAFATSEAWSIYRQIVAYLVVALIIGAGIHGYLPEGFFADFFSGGAWWHVPAATVLGLPLYASANATVPILETLVAKGVPLGTGMALIMSAVGVSLPELVLLKRVMTVRLLALFTLVVSLGVILVGFLFNAL